MNEKFSSIRYRLKRIDQEETAFTLLEVLLALTLTGLLLTLIAPALANLDRFLFRTYDTVERSRIQRLLYRQLAMTLNNVYWYPYFDKEFPGFTGDERGFTVPIVMNQELGEAEYLLSGGELIIKWLSYERQNARSKEPEKGETVLLTNQLVDPAFSYLDGQSGIWRHVWDEDYYPRLVRFTSGYQHKSGRFSTMVPLIIPLQIGQEY